MFSFIFWYFNSPGWPENIIWYLSYWWEVIKGHLNDIWDPITAYIKTVIFGIKWKLLWRFNKTSLCHIHEVFNVWLYIIDFEVQVKLNVKKAVYSETVVYDVCEIWSHVIKFLTAKVVYQLINILTIFTNFVNKLFSAKILYLFTIHCREKFVNCFVDALFLNGEKIKQKKLILRK